MKEFPRKFLNLRDKNGSHSRSKSVSPGAKDKARPLSAEAFRAMFKKDGPKQAAKSEDESSEPDQTKIEEVQRRLDKMRISNVTADYIKDIMATNIADGDSQKTVEFIDLEQKAASGIIVSYDPNVQMLGAENRGNVTCYLDSLLFAMFSKLDAFECMLKSDFPVDDPRVKLVTLLRIWVNLLRSGKLIRTDLTKLMQEALSDCGWSEAKLLEQQDTSEAFAFLTETLQLPLLSLQVDLFHQGIKDKDDHKVVYERLLNLAVPPDPKGKGIKLEDCLEEYFNAKVDVLRDHEEAWKGSVDEKGSGDRSPLATQNTIRLVRAEEGASSSVAVPLVDIAPSQSSLGDSLDRSLPRPLDSPSADINSPEAQSVEISGIQGDSALKPQSSTVRNRSASVIQRVVMDEAGRSRENEDGVTAKPSRHRRSTIVKAVTIPAWQFFRLIPWHALRPNEPRSDSEVALNFDQRPVVGICLKRYAMTESGQPKRHNTFIDIPDSLRLPHFMLAGGPKLGQELNGLSTEYKLVLQSVVCHRGDSLHSGHYIAFARVAPKLLTGNRRHDFDPPPDYEEAQWVKFDDLEAENRVSYVDDIKQALKAEMPYLLFYQIVPMFDMPRCSTDGAETGPPSYNEFKLSLEINGAAVPSCAFDELTGGCPDEPLSVDASASSNTPSMRLSAEMDRFHRGGHWSVSHTGSTPMASRRESLATTESPAVTPGANSPVMTPTDEPTTSRLSRAASRFALSRQSRPQSQSGEGRISLTMTRLGGLMRPSREPLAEPSSNGLPVSATNPTGSLSDTSTKALDSSAEEKQAAPAAQGKEKLKYRGGKAKDKEKPEKHHKANQGDQPERECAVM